LNLKQIFRPSSARIAGQALYEAVTIQARQPAFYTALGVPDTVEGRFELYSLHVVLLLHRFKGSGSQAANTSQALFDVYVSALDNALREMGVGDLSVAKKMRKLGEAFYGRAKAYDAALDEGDRAALTALMARTVFEGASTDGLERLTDYVLAGETDLAAQSNETLFAGRPHWPDIPA
jgi:cytochrome b pre-mRNA-processing protein 3